MSLKCLKNTEMVCVSVRREREGEKGRETEREEGRQAFNEK